MQQLLLSSPHLFGKTIKAGPLPPSYWDPAAWKSTYENAVGDWVSARAVYSGSGASPQPLYNGTAAPCQVYYNPSRRLIVITHRLGLAHKLVGLLGPSCTYGNKPSSPGHSGKRKKKRKQLPALISEKTMDPRPDADCFDVLSIASLKARGLAGAADDWKSNGISRALLDLWRYTVVSFAANPYAWAARSYLHVAGRWKAGPGQGDKCKPLSFADYAMDPMRLALQGGVFRCWEGGGQHWAQDYAHMEPQAACLEAPGPGGGAAGLATDYIIRAEPGFFMQDVVGALELINSRRPEGLQPLAVDAAAVQALLAGEPQVARLQQLYAGCEAQCRAGLEAFYARDLALGRWLRNGAGAGAGADA